MAPPFIDFTGKTFGRLTVIGFAGLNSRQCRLWKCKCRCGKEKIIRGGDLRRKNQPIRSCGCLALEVCTKALLKAATKHGMYRTPAYTAWAHMKARCLNPDHPNYSDYGGRGINVCKEWMKFEGFLSDMGPKPKGLTLDRIDNNKGYNKKNCRWATREQQQNNRRNTRWITYRGETKTATQWIKALGIYNHRR